MAIDIPVHFTDTEQTAITDLVARIAPGLSGQPLIDEVAKIMKRGFRVEFMRLWTEAEATLEQTTKLTRQANIKTSFPEVP